MATATRNPRWGGLSKPLEEVEHLFDQFFGTQGGAGVMQAWRAPLSLWEDQTHFHVEMEAPGLKKEDVELTVENNVLHIAANRRKPEDSRNYWHDERRYGRIERRVTLPDSINPEAVHAELTDGVLHVKLAKKPEAQPRRIPIAGEELPQQPPTGECC